MPLVLTRTLSETANLLLLHEYWNPVSAGVLRAVWTIELGLLEKQLVPLVYLQVLHTQSLPLSFLLGIILIILAIFHPCLKQPCFNAEIIECSRHHFNEIRNSKKISYIYELVLVFYIPTFFIQCNQIQYCAVNMYYAFVL